MANSLRRADKPTKSTETTPNNEHTATNAPITMSAFSTTRTICHNSSNATPGKTAMSGTEVELSLKLSMALRAEKTVARECSPTQTAVNSEGFSSATLGRSFCRSGLASNAEGLKPMPHPM